MFTLMPDFHSGLALGDHQQANRKAFRQRLHAVSVLRPRSQKSQLFLRQLDHIGQL